MKVLRQISLVVILFLVLMAVQSCQKDDAPLAPDTTEQTNTTENEDTSSEEDNGTTPPTDNGDPDDTDTTTNPDDSEGGITLYRVEGNNIVKQQDFKVTGKELEFQKDTKKHQEIWELTKKIVPLEYRSKMGRFMIFAGESDGVAGYVYPLSNDLSKWEMGIAIDFAYYNNVFNEGGELAYTIIHEFGHILTLDDTQVDSSIQQNVCKYFYTGEGCSKEESHINKLHSKFWADIWEEFLAGQDNQSQQMEFYDKYKDRFVTEYASTNPGEDIAEVFATFVTRKGGANGNSIAEQKIKQMYDSQELIKLRNYIRDKALSSKGRSYLPVAGTWKKANTFGNPKEIHCTKPKG